MDIRLLAFKKTFSLIADKDTFIKISTQFFLKFDILIRLFHIFRKHHAFPA